MRRCVYNGKEDCIKQGGTGSFVHPNGYIHNFPTIKETGEPVSYNKSYETNPEQLDAAENLPGLIKSFDEEKSTELLNAMVNPFIDTVGLVKKSIYDFDLETDDGITKILELLPIMDFQVVQDIAGEIWPGYPTQDANPELLKMEVRGYLIDYLYDGHGRRRSGDSGVSEGMGTETEEGTEPQEERKSIEDDRRESETEGEDF